MPLDQLQALVLNGEMDVNYAWELGIYHHDWRVGTEIQCWLIDYKRERKQKDDNN